MINPANKEFTCLGSVRPKDASLVIYYFEDSKDAKEVKKNLWTVGILEEPRVMAFGGFEGLSEAYGDLVSARLRSQLIKSGVPQTDPRLEDLNSRLQRDIIKR